MDRSATQKGCTTGSTVYKVDDVHKLNGTVIPLETEQI
jgi:hypothetical protein